MDEPKINSLKTLFTAKRIQLTLGILFLLAIGVVFFNLLVNSPLVTEPQQIIEDSPNNYAEIPITVSNELIYNNYKATLSTGWEVGLSFDGTRSEDIYCENTLECNIHLVSNGTEQYYISLPSSFTNSQFSTGTIIINKTFAFGDISFTEYFVQDDAELQETTESEETTVPLPSLTTEISGCFEDTICFNSGRLSINEEENRAEMQKFYDFVATVSITK